MADEFISLLMLVTETDTSVMTQVLGYVLAVTWVALEITILGVDWM